MEKLQSIEQFHSLKDNGQHVFYFTAGWCPDCHFIEPFLPEIIDEFSDFTFIEVNRDEFIDLCRDMDIFGIPSFIVYKDGNEAGRFVSKDRKTKEEVVNFLKSVQ